MWCLLRHDRRAGLRIRRCRRRMDTHRARPAFGPVRRGSDAFMIRILLPAHLRTLARVDDEVELEVTGVPTQRAVLDALEARFPVLRGTIRDQVSFKRRPFVRFFACGEDVSHESPDAPLPDAVAKGTESFLVV